MGCPYAVSLLLLTTSVVAGFVTTPLSIHVLQRERQLQPRPLAFQMSTATLFRLAPPYIEEMDFSMSQLRRSSPVEALQEGNSAISTRRSEAVTTGCWRKIFFGDACWELILLAV
jgi:hypothetical protein